MQRPGLTRYEAEGAFSLSLVRHGKVTAESVWELKSQMLKKSGLLSLHRGAESFAQPWRPGGDEEFLPSGNPVPGTP